MDDLSSPDDERPLPLPVGESTAELVEILLDRLGPAVAVYRREAARCAGVSADDLLCIERLRRHGPVPASRVGGWLGVTRSGLSKFVRRLEQAGHVERWAPARRGQDAEVGWRPVAARDAVLDGLRDTMRRDVADLVVGHRLTDPNRHALAAGWMVHMADLFARHARYLADAEEYRQFMERRRRQHAADPNFRWWER